MMNCGLECEIIEYNSAHNITVKFTNGAIAKNKYYYDFQTGIIQCPEYNGDGQLNETKKMLNGMMATIIKYESNTNIDVQFEDGKIRHNVTYNSFISGRLLHPNQIIERQTQGRIGETNQMRNGLQAKNIQYNGYYNVDIADYRLFKCFEKYHEEIDDKNSVYTLFGKAELINEECESYFTDRVVGSYNFELTYRSINDLIFSKNVKQEIDLEVNVSEGMVYPSGYRIIFNGYGKLNDESVVSNHPIYNEGEYEYEKNCKARN